MDDIKSKYKNLLTGVSKFENKYCIKVKNDVNPVIHPPRKVPLALKEKLKLELEKMTKEGIIAPVEEATDWVSSLVLVDKPNKLRICMDSRDLNNAIKRPHHPLPVIEDVISDLGNAKIFTVLDVKNGFWHVELTEESSYLTTFNSPFGRFRWLRLPFGINAASEEFQRRMNEVIEGLDGVKVIIDDLLVYG